MIKVCGYINIVLWWFSETKTNNYELHSKTNGVYIIIKGKANINGHDLNKRDGIGIWGIDSINISNSINSRFY